MRAMLQKFSPKHAVKLRNLASVENDESSFIKQVRNWRLGRLLRDKRWDWMRAIKTGKETGQECFYYRHHSRSCLMQKMANECSKNCQKVFREGSRWCLVKLNLSSLSVRTIMEHWGIDLSCLSSIKKPRWNGTIDNSTYDKEKACVGPLLLKDKKAFF